MNRDILWSPAEDAGLEHLWLMEDGTEIIADSLVIRAEAGAVYRASYQIQCDAQWRVRSLSVSLIDEKSVEVVSDGEGRWQTANGIALPEYNGCIDVDITLTPFTNTLPIRRLALEVGAAADIQVLYVVMPDLKLTIARQRYTRLETHRYSFEDETGFSAVISVDDDGLVLDYPGLFRRVG